MDLKDFTERGFSSDGQTVVFVDLLLQQAVSEGASDIHVEPLGKGARVRFRLDGLLREVCLLSRQAYERVVSRIKVLSGMDITERRVPQDGHWENQILGHRVDFRSSSMPVLQGEKLVVRVLDKQNAFLGLDELGFSVQNLARYRRLVGAPYGMVLVTGPTGSGKTTTLYATLVELNSPERNIITIEDPPEYQLPGINQVPVNPRQGLNFANGLRSMLRQDPDVIMVGEIRDEETARIAVQAALTGHLVLSTLHTNDAVLSVTRLLDMHIEPYLLSACLRGVVAQRLVRSVCAACGGAGCDRCFGSGLVGRLAVQEVLDVSDKLSALISRSCSESELRCAALADGFVSMLDDGKSKVLAGRTTLAEVLRVTGVEEL